MNKVLSCVLCFLPAVLFVVSIAMIIIFSVVVGEGTVAGASAIFAIIMLLTAVLCVVAVYGVMIWLIIKTCKNGNITGGMKAAWVVMLYLLNIFVFPVYWFIYIRCE